MGANQFRASLKRLSAESDDDLKSYFTTTDSIRALSDFDSDKVLAVGLKGIGKSATFRYFTEIEKQADITIGINWRIYKLHLSPAGLHYSTCQEQFEQDLVIEALRAVSEKRAQIQKRIGKPLFDEAARQFESYRELLLQAAGRFRGISVLGCGFTIGNPESKVLAGLRRSDETKKSLEVLRQVCDAGIKIRVVVDDPELVFSVSQELDTSLIGGFFLAAFSLSSKIPRFKVLALVKTHVYYPVDIKIEELDKYPDLKVDLSWTREELVEVVANRIRWAKASWEAVFDLPEKETRKLIATSLCDRIRNGPRDLLRWLDLALDASPAGKVTTEGIERVRKDMARYALKSLERSFEASYPKVTAVIQAIFRNSQHKHYSLQELRNRIEELLPTDKAMMNLANLRWMQEETSDTLPEVLFKVGSLALGVEGHLVLPYEQSYDTEHFERADYICLAPALIEAV